jgi:predicted ferric reductase
MANVDLNDSESLESSLRIETIFILVFALILGILAAAVIFPIWSPGLVNSLAGDQAKGFWYLSRGSAIAAFVLLWISMASGLIITNKMARMWPGGPTAFSVHEYTSLLGIAFGAFHALILLGDNFINYTLPQVLLPFASVNYHPFWVGIGQLGLYLWIIVSATFYVRKSIGHKAWRLIHFASFAVFLMALLHGFSSGTDSNTIWAQAMYWFAGGSLLFLTIYRVLIGLLKPTTAGGRAAPAVK